MQLGLVGLGKMGFNMRERLREGGHEVDRVRPATRSLRRPDTRRIGGRARRPRGSSGSWCRPGPITDETIVSLADVLSEGDLVIDGGNSRYTEDGPHAKLLADKGIALHRRGCFRRHLGTDRGLRPDGRRQRRRRGAGDADLRHTAAPRPARGRIRPRRTGWRRPLREDGPQRHRVRADDRLRRRVRTARRRRPDHRIRRRSIRRGRTARSSGPGCSSCWRRR